MSRALKQIWKVVVKAKERAKERLEDELTQARQHHEGLLTELAEANAQASHAKRQQLAHEEKIANMLADPRGLSPSAYLDYDVYRAPLAQTVEEAKHGVRRASEAADEQQRAVERLKASVRRAEASVDAAREQLKKTIADAQRREQERTDEEAAETAAARMRRGESNA
ncbi:hypothetical protein FAZ69_03385 [Trinickia terrae]|uniref:Type III secretion protein n=1 Tax=Trinickia terrae TaxID=2571161 RepID=A0A4V5PJI4_9BURK|nr:hypothetical protein [Trinickia terrae]TKC91510.1 hypothetical protein FAZ69_03385 [Trinickia terrae]